MTFGKTFKLYRQASGLSQGDVSKMLGWTSPQFVSNIERGISYMPLKHLKKCCQKYGWPYDYMVRLLYKKELAELQTKYGIK